MEYEEKESISLYTAIQDKDEEKIDELMEKAEKGEVIKIM